jgi:hypothetical protein
VPGLALWLLVAGRRSQVKRGGAVSSSQHPAAKIYLASTWSVSQPISGAETRRNVTTRSFAAGRPSHGGRPPFQRDPLEPGSSAGMIAGIAHGHGLEHVVPLTAVGRFDRGDAL